MRLKTPLLFPRLIIAVVALSLAAGVMVGQSPKAPKDQPPKDQAPKEQTPKPVDAKSIDLKNLTAEQIAEVVIAFSGSRVLLSQIRRNGVERGRLSSILPDGQTEEARYELRFVHGDKADKDKFRLDRKTPQTEYSLVYGEGKMFGVINGSTFTPRADASADFISMQTRSIDALLRYKENESKLSSAGKDKQQGIDLHVIDLTDKANRRTRYFISAKTFRVLWLEYEDTPPGGNAPVKYTKRFYDYHIVQNTLVPYRTVVFEDGKQSVETRIMTITFGVKMEDALFQSPDAQTSASNPQ